MRTSFVKHYGRGARRVRSKNQAPPCKFTPAGYPFTPKTGLFAASPVHSAMTLLRTLFPLAFAGTVFAQYPGLTLPPSGRNQKASVTQYIGPVKASIDYSSPAVHGPVGKDRRGQI